MDQGDIDLRAFASVLRRQIRLIAACTIAVIAVAGFCTLFLPQVYTATALVLVDPRSKDLLSPADVALGASSDNARIDSEVEVLRSDALLRKVAHSAALAEPATDPNGTDLENAVRELRAALYVQRRAATHVLSIEARSRNPAEAAQIANAVADVYIEDQLASKVSGVLAARDMLQSQIEVARAALVRSNSQGSNDRDQTSALARSQYNLLLARAQELDAQSGLQLADSRILSPAFVPHVPSFPDHRLIFALSALAGISGGVGLAFLRENIVGGLTSEEQATAVLKVSAANSVPKVKTSLPLLGASDLVVTAPLSVFAEAIRRIRPSTDQILRRSGPAGEPGKVIMVTSSVPGEGKTTISLALARSYAQAGHKAILIDCDLRKPSVHRHLGLEPSEGLYDFLEHSGEDHALLSAITSRDPKSQATVILGAHESTTPTDQLLSGMAFPRLIDAARKVFDVVIVDTPPLGPVVDGLYLAPHADAVVFVVRFAATPQSEARQSLARLQAALRPGLDVVAALNQQDGTGERGMKSYAAYYRRVE
jgi:capsular exopolysaccharide synthesis family protein